MDLGWKRQVKRLEFEGGNEEDRELVALYSNAKQKVSFSGEDVEQLYSLNSIRSALMKFDLSKNEIRVYLYLARSGTERAQNIAEALLVHRTETYKILRRLEKQGLVSCTLERPMKFLAVPFDKALSNLIENRRQRLKALERRREELIELWSALPKIERIQSMDETFQILEGKEQINVKAEELLRRCKKELFIAGNEDYLLRLYNSTFFDDFAKLSRKHKFDARILTNFCQTTSYILERIDLGEADFSYLDDLEEVPSFIVSDGEEFLFSLGSDEGTSYAVCTNYRSLVKSFRLLFLLLWKKSSTPVVKTINLGNE
jgi:sugar-specific transcriptional regulator TrmB